MLTRSPYVIYRCDTCSRETEIELDARRPDPQRCNITLRCRGKLLRVGQNDLKKFLFTPTVSGLTDYSPRGTAASSATAVVELPQISLLTSRDVPGLTIAVLKRRVNGSTSEFYVDQDFEGAEFITEILSSSIEVPADTTGALAFYELKPELLRYKKYSYLINATVQSVSGADDSPDQNNLRFTSENSVRVYVNGVELESSEFDRTVDDQITFTPMLTTTSNLIEILVFNDISSTIDPDDLIRVAFELKSPTVNEDLEVRANFCWGDATSVEIEEADRFCFFATDLSDLDAERTYGLAHLELTSSSGLTKIIDPSEGFILLGKHPFSTVDKELFAYARISNLIDDVVFSYGRGVSSGVLELTVDDVELTQTFTPLDPTGEITVTEVETVTSPEGTVPLKRKYTLGPT